jgi:peptide/nickel transport system substrate-binding protein
VTTGQISRRMLLRGAAAGGGLVAFTACTGGNGTKTPPPTTAPGLPSVEGGTLILDPAQFPKALKESPDFAAQVAAGKLPPVAERIGQDPLFIRPVNGVGKYGGLIRRGIINEDSVSSTFCAGPDGFLYWDYEYKNIVPNIARDFEVSKDLKEVTLHLRRGMRWSDGHPFTADDVMFWREDINLNPDIGYPSITLSIDGKNVAVEKVDDYTVVFRSPVPYATLAELIASNQDASGPDAWGAYAGGGFAPKHYLSQFLPKYTSDAQATRLAQDAGFHNWPAYILDRNTWTSNTDLPTVTPWKCTRPITNPPWEFEANPYSIWVDSDGNQLPYVPSVSFENVDDPNVLALNAVSGDYDFADRGLQITSLPLLIKNESRSEFTVRKAPDRLMDLAVIFNLSYVDDQEMGDLIRTTDFRRALSLGIDRDQVNETFFLETSIPSCTMVSDDSPYFPGPEWRLKWAELDLDQANEMLDELGLTKRNGDGFRMLPSGKGPVRIEMQATNSKADFPTWGEMIRRQWTKIGIDSSSDLVDGALLYERAQANKVMAALNNVYGVEEPFLNPNCLLPLTTAGTGGGTFGIEYSKWFLSNGKEGTEPPESMQILKDTVALYRKGLALPKEQRIDIGKKVVQTHADEVWTIGVVGMGLLIYGIYLSKDNLANVPQRFINTGPTANDALAQPFAFYYDT